MFDFLPASRGKEAAALYHVWPSPLSLIVFANEQSASGFLQLIFPGIFQIEDLIIMSQYSLVFQLMLSLICNSAPYAHPGADTVVVTDFVMN